MWEAFQVWGFYSCMSLQVVSYRMEEMHRRDHVRSHGEIPSVNLQVPEPPIRVLVANRTEIESELLADVINKNRRFVAVGWGVQHAEIYSLAGNTDPDVLLITPKLDDKPCAGLELISDLRIWHPALKVVVLLESHEKDVVVQSFRLGARGIFSKDSPLRMLVKCIVRVHEGQIWATNEHFSIIVEALSAPQTGYSFRNKRSKLSTRHFR
jgi:DNA-binding NarL/FixJ family response regulator